MPPILALTGCTVLVLALLWAERRAYPNASWSLLIPTFWLLVVASRPLGAWLGGTAGSFDEGSPIDRFVLTGVISAALVVVVRRMSAFRLSIARIFPLFIFFAYLAVTMLWSEYAFVSMKRWVRLAGVIPLALLLATEPDPEHAIAKILRRIPYILIPYSLILIKYYPHLGCGYSRWSGTLMWHGVTPTKNALGQLCVLSALGLVWLTTRRLWEGGGPAPRSLLAADALVFGLTLYLMLGTPSGAYSATSVAVLLLACGALLALNRFRHASRGLAAGLTAAAVAGWFGMMFAQTFLEGMTGLLGRDETLTGRTDIWAMAFRDAAAHPLLGAGFGGYFNTPNEFTNTFGNTAHNGILDTYVETGAVGVAVLLVFLAAVFFAYRQALGERFQVGVLATSVLLVNLLSNFTESLFLKSSSYAWTMMVVLYVIAALRPWRVPHADSPGVDGQLPRTPGAPRARTRGSSGGLRAVRTRRADTPSVRR